MAAPSTPQPQLRVLVLGGIASGKSTISRVFGDSGAVIISADEIGHEVLEPNGPAFADVAERWPVAVSDGRIDRAALARIVFTDGEQLSELEALTHPHIAARIEERVDEIAPKPAVVEMPITKQLLGDGWVTVVVDAARSERIRWAVRRGMSETDARARLRSQPDRSAWLELADHVILNDNSLDRLERRATAVWQAIVAEHDAARWRPVG